MDYTLNARPLYPIAHASPGMWLAAVILLLCNVPQIPRSIPSHAPFSNLTSDSDSVPRLLLLLRHPYILHSAFTTALHTTSHRFPRYHNRHIFQSTIVHGADTNTCTLRSQKGVSCQNERVSYRITRSFYLIFQTPSSNQSITQPPTPHQKHSTNPPVSTNHQLKKKKKTTYYDEQSPAQTHHTPASISTDSGTCSTKPGSSPRSTPSTCVQAAPRS